MHVREVRPADPRASVRLAKPNLRVAGDKDHLGWGMATDAQNTARPPLHHHALRCSPLDQTRASSWPQVVVSHRDARRLTAS